MMRCATLLLLGLCGCSAVGHHRVAGTHAEVEAAADRPRVVLVVAEGLRADTVERYLRVLRHEDFAPEWHSGLALLWSDTFRLATSTRAEAPLPAGGLAAMATLVTGAYPDGHGVAASRAPGFDFGAPADAGRIYYADGFRLPGADGTALTRMLRRPTIYERLGSTHRTAAVFHPFGRGATWYVPDDAGTAVTALLPDATGAAATPLLDEGTRSTAIEVLLTEDPDVVTMGFRGVLTESCFQPEADCEGGRGDLARVQDRALRALDAHLWRMLRKLRAARPAAYANTTVLLVGTGGVVERGGAEHAIPPELLREWLATRSDEACARWWREGEARFTPNSGSLQIDLPPAPPGQQHRVRRGLACIDATLRSMLGDESCLAGAAWMPPDGLDRPGPYGARMEARLQPVFAGTMPVHRRDRALRKMRRAMVGEPAALLFADTPWHFTGRRDGRHPVSAPGGLEDAAVGAAFLVASQHLEEDAARALRTTPVELADVAPTVLALVAAPVEAFEGLDRPPVLRRDDDAVRLRRADRQIAQPRWTPAPTATWSEDDETVRVALVEPVKAWPPESVTLRFGAARWTWSADEGAWPEGAPCGFAEADGRRLWRCEAKVDRSVPKVVVAATRRDPALSGEGMGDSQWPAVLGDAAPTVHAAALVCATEKEARIRLHADDPLGLATVTIEAVDAAGPSAAGRHSVQVGTLTTADCDDPTADACAYSATVSKVDEVLTLPWPATAVGHHVRAAKLRRPTKAQRAALATSGLDPAPRAAWVALEVCNLAGRCVRRALVTGAGYAAAARAGCAQ